MPRVFLSHSSQDREFVEKLAIRLSRAGVDVWYDKWEIRVGDSVAEKIENGISVSDSFVAVLSEHSVKSPWVRKELDAAIAEEIGRKGAYILPVLAEDCEIPPLLAGKRYANFATSPDQAFEELVEAIVLRRSDTASERRLRSRLAIDAIQLYTTLEGSDFAVYEGEEERGLDYVTEQTESKIGTICVFLINEIHVDPSRLNREKGSFVQKIGYPNGSVSSLVTRSQEGFFVWEAEVVAEVHYDVDRTASRKIFAGLVKQIRWQGVRYLVQASLDDARAIRLFKSKGFRIVRYLPGPLPSFQLNIPSWQMAQYDFALDKKEVSPTFRLEQLSPSLLRISIDFGRCFPDAKCWPRGRPWDKLRPANVLNEFRDVLGGTAG